MHLSQLKKEDIYDTKKSENEKSEDVNGNLNKDKSSLLPSNSLFMNQKRVTMA